MRSQLINSHVLFECMSHQIFLKKKEFTFINLLIFSDHLNLLFNPKFWLYPSICKHVHTVH